MKSHIVLPSILLFLLMALASRAQPGPSRKDLLQVLMKSQTLSRIEVKEITMPAGQTAPKHSHPCPVVGYVSSGSVILQVEGEPKKVIRQGEAFYEPKDKVILHFDNASQQEPLVFIAFYLKEDQEDLIRLIDK